MRFEKPILIRAIRTACCPRCKKQGTETEGVDVEIEIEGEVVTGFLGFRHLADWLDRIEGADTVKFGRRLFSVARGIELPETNDPNPLQVAKAYLQG